MVRDALAATRVEIGVRIVHFSVQSNHLHLIVEARDREALGRGFRAIGVRIARRLNVALRRQGRVLADRFHSRVLRSPLAVKRSLAYVLGNAHHHSFQLGAPPPVAWIDRHSSAPWFDGFVEADAVARALGVRGLSAGPPPVLPATTWLLRIGWRRHGLIDPDHIPGQHRR